MKIAFRNFLTTLRRYKTVSLLNIVGLTFAFAACYAILTQVHWELTYNASIPCADRTYLVVSEDNTMGLSPHLSRRLMDLAIERSPEVESAAILDYTWNGPQTGDDTWVRRSEALAPEKLGSLRAGAINDGFLEMFGRGLVQGDLEALHDPGKVILVRSVAEHFHIEVGDLLYVFQGNPETPKEVGAIIEDFSDNVMFSNFQVFCGLNETESNRIGIRNAFYVVRLHEGADPQPMLDRFGETFEEVVRTNVPNWEWKSKFSLEPVREIYFGQLPGLEHGVWRKTLTQLAIALLVVLIALINFTNFFFALVPVRVKTVNISKVFGASTRELRFGFLFEAVAFVVLGLGGAAYLLLAFSKTFVVEFFPHSLSPVQHGPVVVVLLAGAVAAVLAVSLWPVHYITSFPPSLAARGIVGSPRGRRLRIALIGTQFVVAMVLIALSLTMWRQYRYLCTADPGYTREHVLVMANPNAVEMKGNRVEAFASELQQIPEVRLFSFASRRLPHKDNDWNWAIPKSPDGQEDDQMKFFVVNCDSMLLRVLDIPVIEGRDFTLDDRQHTRLIVNQRASLDYDIHPDGDFHTIDNDEVVGVCRDFQFSSLRYGLAPLLFNLERSDQLFYRYLYLRVAPGFDLEALTDKIYRILHGIDPTVNRSEVHLQFLTDVQAEIYRQERHDILLVSGLSLLTMLIALMGVFGLVLFETLYRRREVAIRKVNGATTGEILRMFNRQYVWIVTGCFAIAAPVAWFCVDRWLSGFACRVPQAGWMIPLAFVLVLAITLGVVTARSWRTAETNPVEIMKN